MKLREATVKIKQNDSATKTFNGTIETQGRELAKLTKQNLELSRKLETSIREKETVTGQFEAKETEISKIKKEFLDSQRKLQLESNALRETGDKLGEVQITLDRKTTSLQNAERELGDKTTRLTN